MTDEWQAGAISYPERMILTPEQQDEIKRHLWSVGITQDPFTMDPYARVQWLSRSRSTALTVYAAIKHVTKGEYELAQSFSEWCRMLELPW